MSYPTNYAPFNADLAALDPLYNLPEEDSDKYDYHVARPKPDVLLEAFADVWMEVVEDDANVAADYEALLVDNTTTSTTAAVETSSTPATTTAPLVIEIDMDETTTPTIPPQQTAATTSMDMDDAVSVVSVEEECQTRRRPMVKKSSFLDTCWDIDSFMARAVQEA